jgi:hypothetical protein
MGLIGVVSIPRVFAFRLDMDDPHPMPWFRVKISVALGEVLFPHPQWQAIRRLWETLYPPEPVEPFQRACLRLLDETLPTFAQLVVDHRPPRLKGLSLREAIVEPACKPEQLRQLFQFYMQSPGALRSASPVTVMAAIGQVRFDGSLAPIAESALISRMLRSWAVADALYGSRSPARDSLRQTNSPHPTLTN